MGLSLWSARCIIEPEQLRRIRLGRDIPVPDGAGNGPRQTPEMNSSWRGTGSAPDLQSRIKNRIDRQA